MCEVFNERRLFIAVIKIKQVKCAVVIIRIMLQTGRVLTGPAERECLEDGSWSGEVPLCRKLNLLFSCRM